MRIMKLLLHFFAISSAYFYILAEGKSAEQAVMERIFKEGTYDRRVRPIPNNNASAPVAVAVNLFLRRVDKLENYEMNVQLTFRQQWRDERLSFSSSGGLQYISVLNPETLIWRPDTFFSNEIEGKYHNLMLRNEFARITPRGDVMQSVRISLKLSCPYSLKKFPFDKPICPIRLASYGYTSSAIKYVWERDNPVQVSKKPLSPMFFLTTTTTDYCDSITTTGEYSCLSVDLAFQRSFTPYWIHVYIPCTMMVIVSWFSFWVNSQAVTARVILTGLTLFVLAIQTADVNKTFPEADYTRSVDVWTGVCLTFVMASLVEFIIVQYIARHRDSGGSSTEGTGNGDIAESSDHNGGDEEQEIPLKDPNQSESKEDQGQTPTKSGPAQEIKQRTKEAVEKYVSRFALLSEKIDGVSRVAFPIAFVLFNIIYWPVYS